MNKRKPDYKAGIMNKRTGEKAYSVGSAWINDTGTIALYFDPFIVVPGGPDVLITLFPYDEARDGKKTDAT